VSKRGASPSFKTISSSLVRVGDKGGRLLTSAYNGVRLIENLVVGLQ